MVEVRVDGHCEYNKDAQDWMFLATKVEENQKKFLEE